MKALILATLAICAGGGAYAETVYPILDPRFAYASERHVGETRVGSVGVIAKLEDITRAETGHLCTEAARDSTCSLEFRYSFNAADPAEFAGIFFSFGRTAIPTTFKDGTAGPEIELPKDSTFDFVDLMRSEGPMDIGIERVRFVLRPNGGRQRLNLKFEIQDSERRQLTARRELASEAAEPQTFDIRLTRFAGNINLRAVKTLAIVVEEQPPGIDNPLLGGFVVEEVSLIDEDGPDLNAADVAGMDDREMVETLARRDFEALLRVTDAFTGASLDRTLARDLIHWGATGWLLAALPTAVELGWIDEETARAHGLRILEFLDQDERWCNLPNGCIGNGRGMIYRFGGIDARGFPFFRTGTRKIDLGNPNAVEASTIDTAILQFGAATFAAGFPEDAAALEEAGIIRPTIQERAQTLLDRTKWTDLVDPETGQLQLAWKPLPDGPPGPLFTVPAGGRGYWATRENGAALQAEGANQAGPLPLTIDFLTDEGGLAAILAAGSAEHPTGPGPWYRMQRVLGDDYCDEAYVTFPGAWFTSTFLSATYLDPALGRDLGPDRGVAALDWTENARQIFFGHQSVRTVDGVLLPDFAELPDTTALAQGRAPCAVNKAARFPGVRTPYSVQLALGLGEPIATSAISSLRLILRNRPEVWDPLVGFLDSYHADLAGFETDAQLVRSSGLWVNQQVFPINKGAALLAQLNYLADDAVRRTAAAHPVIARGIEAIYRSRSDAPTATSAVLATLAPPVTMLAPRSIITVFGDTFAEDSAGVFGPELISDGRVGDNIANFCMEIGGSRSAMFAATRGQVNAQVGPGVGTGSQNLVLIRACGTDSEQRSEPRPVEIVEASPAFFKFAFDDNGENPIAALNQAGQSIGGPDLGGGFVGSCPGEVVTLFGTGFGPVEEVFEAGEIPGRASRVTGEVTVEVGGQTLPGEDVLYVGVAPCCAGLDQASIRLPGDARSGDLAVRLTISGASSPAGAVLYVEGR